MLGAALSTTKKISFWSRPQTKLACSPMFFKFYSTIGARMWKRGQIKMHFACHYLPDWPSRAIANRSCLIETLGSQGQICFSFVLEKLLFEEIHGSFWHVQWERQSQIKGRWKIKLPKWSSDVDLRVRVLIRRPRGASLPIHFCLRLSLQQNDSVCACRAILSVSHC